MAVHTADAQVGHEEARAIKCIDALIEAHGIGVTSELRAVLQARDGKSARAAMLRAFGYVPADPKAWARLQVGRHRFDGPLDVLGGRASCLFED